MRYLIAFLAMLAFGAQATVLQHTLQTGHRTTESSGHLVATSDLHGVEKTYTGDADHYRAGTGCADCWTVDNGGAGGSFEKVVSDITTISTTHTYGGSQSEYCDTSLAVNGLYAAQKRETGSGFEKAITDSVVDGTITRDYIEWGTSGNGGAEDSWRVAKEHEVISLEGTSRLVTNDVFDFTVLVSIVE